MIADLQEEKNIRETLIRIKQQIREDEDYKARFLQWEQEHHRLPECLGHEDPKVRKNAALLIGELGLQENIEALWEAYQTEQTLFVKSSYLTAMERLDFHLYTEKLHELYEKLCSMQPAENEKKHYKEQLKVLGQMLRSMEPHKRHKFSGYDKELDVLLLTNSSYREVTASQIRDGKVLLTKAGVRVKTTNLRELLAIRTYQEMIFFLPGIKRVQPDPEKMAEMVVQAGIVEYLKKLHASQETPFYFRVEMRGRQDDHVRRSLIHKFAEALEEQSDRELINAVDDYEVEIRLAPASDGTYLPCLKFFTIPMRRFAYRKQSVAATTQPATAALLMQLAKKYLTEGAQVLDPFCGVGTMLIERDLLVAAGDMYGTDIFGEAVKKGRENALAAGMNINFINRNFFDFTHKYLFDEIVTDMPLRGKKTREEQDGFYADFFRKVTEVLRPGGYMFLYSNENGFVKKQLRLHKEFRLVKEDCIREKTGYYFFVIRYKE